MQGISESWINTFIDQALQEDVGAGDYTSLACIQPTGRSKASLKVKDVGIIAGVELAERIMKRVDPDHRFTRLIEDGTDVCVGDIAFTIEANSQALLKAERLILNSMQRMSGIATMSERFSAEVEGLPVTILDTRKTTPLLRPLEKWAVRIGGCSNYRDGLYDWIMIKDNHILACGGISKAIEAVRSYASHMTKIEVECTSIDQVDEAARAGVDVILLDNMDPFMMREAVKRHEGKVLFEASGGITLDTVRGVAQTGVNFISVGALTHSAPALPFHLEVDL